MNVYIEKMNGMEKCAAKVGTQVSMVQFLDWFQMPREKNPRFDRYGERSEIKG